MFLVHLPNNYLLDINSIYGSLANIYPNLTQIPNLTELNKIKYAVGIPSVSTTSL